jgi:hypothetical protein
VSWSGRCFVTRVQFGLIGVLRSCGLDHGIAHLSWLTHEVPSEPFVKYNADEAFECGSNDWHATFFC